MTTKAEIITIISTTNPATYNADAVAKSQNCNLWETHMGSESPEAFETEAELREAIQSLRAGFEVSEDTEDELVSFWTNEIKLQYIRENW